MQDQKLQLDESFAPEAFSINPNYIQIGDTFARTMFLATYPRYLSMSWFSPIINLDKAFNVSIYVVPKNTADTLKQLRDQLGRLEAQAMEGAAKGQVRDPLLETAIGDIESLRDKLQQGTDRFFELGVYITFFENDVKLLDETENKIKGMFENQLVFPKSAIFRMAEGFSSTLPLNNDKLNVHTSLNTEPISSIFPFVSFDLTSTSGILYGINTHNNSLVLFDRFSLENSNTVVFGKSGGGKSYTVKLEILRSLIFGVQAIIIDPEDEYKYLAETVGGSVVKVSISSDQHINPFDLPIPKEDESASDIFKSHILNLTGLVRLMLGDITSEEETLLDEALRQTYAIKDIGPDSDFGNMAPPVMTDLQNVLDGMQGSESLAVRLRRFTQGTFAGFLNQPTNISLDNQIVVFSIRDMEEELRPIAMYIVLNFMWTAIRRNLKRRILLVDEAWILLRTKVGANFLSSIAKRARKYYAGLTTISQDIPEFLATDDGKSILNNSSIQILMKQSPATIDLIQKTFSLTNAEKYYLLEARVGFGLFFLGQTHVGIRMVSSFAEDQIITSDPKQILEIEKAKEDWAKTRD
ncbi:MAG: Type IV secretory pathway VirB4 component-like protein [Candidatus Yanofskybacteria bacterium GW2011_GWF1_44_227]|uniref:Type IV secretory pathway VirB4 component-like protein n=1 Tax=Candidatus Yanofskybacteria bacterium GW2011_GWE2_40_11 TaxID=1619033 RepID=A0A0G0QTJ7_9BACT|nr:MAG: Type IV secretory pathway VirB4 component-like protein [Candidatus Yanofskybacteria bacterium GW2011_GWE1_40_10]KKR40646.1 MAG: Type IV secretory pathway VirB4 component-like protein [Candidatus Yanofskybacteria bacterium GW2011_GWE2_40_11]KKT15793.1 MAG: Type IV secretory pathway VirB4 component-like protein [Candidatus Yanofskybacteria bacterium GW2011_GWF2_43_596]KKT53483.1 MAG: Type IV secretory pathway VirB4 component-like protein [Candidatus Yanofskybacteria bacterium GW2011_GWF1_4